MKEKNTKKSLIASGISVLLCVALFVGTTFAWFTDSVTNSGNKIQAGNLQIELNEFKDGKYTPVSTDPIFNYDKWEPGYTDVHAFQIKNSGTLALKYQLDIIKQGENETNNVNIADVIDVYVDLDNNAISELPKNLDGMTKIGTLSEVLAGENGAVKGHLSAGNSDYAVIALKMQETAGNEYQNAALGATFDIVLKATQYTEEKDGFGNSDYDAGAAIAWTGETDDEGLKENTDTVEKTVSVDTPEQLAAFASSVSAGNSYKGYTVTLKNSMNLDGKEWMPIGTSDSAFEGNFDGNGCTISNLKLDMTGSNYVGLFGFTKSGKISNVHVHNAEVKGGIAVGVVAGSPYTTKYSNIKLTGTIKVDGESYVGSVFGRNAYNNLTNIDVDVTEDSYVRADSGEYRTYVGGIVGFMGEGNIIVSNVASNIDVYGSTCDVGGITGIAHYGNTFENCSSSGDVYLTNSTYDENKYEIGGIAGVWMNSKQDNVTLRNCSFTGKLHAIHNSNDISDEIKGNVLTGSKYYPESNDGKLIIE